MPQLSDVIRLVPLHCWHSTELTRSIEILARMKSRCPMLRLITAIVLVLFASSAALADWQHWRGTNRNGVVSDDSGWDGKAWIKGELWRFSAGEGSSSPIVVGDRVYLTGWANNRDSVICLNADTGKELWRQTYASPRYGRFAVGDQGFYAGACSTPEFDAESSLLFTLGIDGAVNAWNTKSAGKRVWGVNIYDRYGAKQRPEVAKRRKTRRDYGYTTSPLVIGNQVIVEVGGTTGNLVAFDKSSGRELWVSKNRDEAGHTGGPVPMTVDGVPCVVVLTLRNLVVTRVDGSKAGQTVAEYPWTTDFANNIPTPAVSGDSVIITSSYNHKSMCRVRVTLQGATKVWESIEVQSAVCSPVIHEGHIYWAWRGIHCVDFATGKELWTGGKNGTPGSCVVTADNRLVVYGDKGELSLLETAKRSPDKFTQRAAVRVLSRTDAWPHVAVANGRVICRDRSGAVVCLATSAGLAAKLKVKVASTPTSPRPTPPRSKPPVLPPAKLNLTTWPGTGDPGLFYAWKRGMGTSAPLGAIAKNRPAIQLVSRNGARFDADGRMAVRGGSYHVREATTPLIAAAKKSGELTIEAIITAPDLKQVGPARIVTFSTDGYHRNFTLAQERDELILRLRTPRTGANGMNPQTILGRIQGGKLQHVLVTYRDGELVAYINGKQAASSNRVRGDFSNWDAQQQLVFGAEYQDGRSWDGVFDGIAVLTRFVGPKEAAARYQSVIGKPPLKSTSKLPDLRRQNQVPSTRRLPLTQPTQIASSLATAVKPWRVKLPFSATVHAGAVARENCIAELSIELEADVRHFDVTNSNGDQLHSQWIPSTRTLLVELPGKMAANSTQTLQVSAGNANQEFKSVVSISDAGIHEGADSWEIKNAVGQWYFAKTGGGFGSLNDADGNDWINYHPSGGSAGNYRGLPNLVHPEGVFHAGSGKTKCTTQVLSTGPLAVSLLVTSNDGKWCTRWEIFRRHARCTVLKADHAYWFLYEGTPGGKLDLDGNDVVIRDGRSSSAARKWQGASHNWVAFADRKANRSLLLVHPTTDDHEDTYWPMQGNMTVFGFGRTGLRKSMTATPNVFLVQLLDTVDPAELARFAELLKRPLLVSGTK